MNVLCVIAMTSEALLIEKKPPVERVLLTGVGKVNAAFKLSEYLAKHSVDWILNLGFAGATPGYQIGDLVLITESSYHDFDLSAFGYAKGQVPGYPEVFLSDYQHVKRLQEAFPTLKQGRLLTGDYFMTDQRKGEFVVDMEGAALYQVAYHYQIPILSIKVISDILGMDHHLESFKVFAEEEGAKRLKSVYDAVIDLMK